jgi:hypothetical protein
LTRKTHQQFSLPRLGAGLAAEMYGFYRDGSQRLGFYSPGGQPEIYDPLWTRTRSPESILVHEDVHQQLTINSHHGILAQILSSLAKSGNGRRALRVCIEEQWSVQEVAATYAELATVQRFKPEDFDAAVRLLPKQILNQPPYWDLFRSVNEVLPLQASTEPETSIAQLDLILTLAGCAMQTRCLAKFSSAGFNDEDFASYLKQESPHLRFERIVSDLGSETLRDFAEDAAVHLRLVPGLPESQIIADYMTRIVSKMRGFPIEPFDTLQLQAEAAMAAFNKMGDRSLISRPDRKVPSPAFVDSPEKQRRLQEFLRTGPAAPSLPDWLLRSADIGGDVRLILGSLSPEGAPFAAVCIAKSPNTPVPDDLRSTLPPETLLDALKPYKAFPQMVSFLGDSWMEWYAILGGYPHNSWVHKRLSDAIRICVHRKLSVDLMQRLLDFEDIGQDARGFVFGLGNGLYVGCIFSPSNPQAYALQKIPSEIALGLFNKFLSDRAVRRESNPERAVPHFKLLGSMARREFEDPPDFQKMHA